MKTVTSELLAEITRRLVIEFDPEQIILFGSHAWGTPTEDSDVDLLVIVGQSQEKPIDRAMRGHRCLGGLNIPKDVLVKTRAEVERFRHVHRGKVLYGRSEARAGVKLAH